MQFAGFSQTAAQSASDLYAAWKHLPEDECVEQIEAHMESEGFDQDEINAELDALGLYVLPEYVLATNSPA